MSWAAPDDIFFSTSLAAYLDSNLSFSLSLFTDSPAMKSVKQRKTLILNPNG